MAIHLDRGAIELIADGRDLREVLAELFVGLDVNYSLPPEVQGAVTISLHNASLRQALDILLRPHFTFTIGPHDTIYVHRTGTTWKPGWETPD